MRLAAKSRKGTARRAPAIQAQKRLFRKIVIVGVGLIGGSLGMAARKKRLADTIIGVGPRADELRRAVARKAVDRYEADFRNIEKAVHRADLVILAAPVGQLKAVSRELAPCLSEGTVVTDVGSVKGYLVRHLEELFSSGPSNRTSFVGGHPIAGRERSGIEAASANLFTGALCILTPTDRTSPEAFKKVQRFWEAIGVRTVSMDPDTHDRILAVVSHLPHLIAYALVNTALELQSKSGDLLSYSAGGFRDFTRVASSSPEMWRDICMANRENLLAVIEAYEKTLDRFKRLLVEGHAEGLQREFERARTAKEKLN
ncbi:MAG TPA: prephenate dehydrogenase/arogenate dehydrogenase family protein [Nitrospiria bacterium]|jgi:prephenate dehydrogenase|nr:prephenate dehydrogenase/arogenate dehydrogenase family protein [Nitrospiria bacterium]